MNRDNIINRILVIAFCVMICFIFLMFSYKASAEVPLYKLVEAEKEAYPVANYKESHIVGKCDKDSTKKFAHFKSSGDFHKAKDVDLVLGTYPYCCEYTYYESGKIKSQKCDSGCIAAARHSEERQRYDVKDGLTKGGLLIPILINTLGAL